AVHAVASLRGTGNLLEWLKAAQGLPVPHDRSNGHVEMGFSSIYGTMTYRAYSGGQFVGAPIRASKGIAAALPDGKLTVVGHSLGSALATYLALYLVTIEKMGYRIKYRLIAANPTDSLACVYTFILLIKSNH